MAYLRACEKNVLAQIPQVFYRTVLWFPHEWTSFYEETFRMKLQLWYID